MKMLGILIPVAVFFFGVIVLLLISIVKGDD